MEGVPKAFENTERSPDWRALKEQAPTQAKERIDAIEGFDAMEPEQQARELDSLIEQLANEGNHNRFVAETVAREKERIQEEHRHAARLQELGVRS